MSELHNQSGQGTEGALEVALFPIPNAVAFPGTAMPLHVFEPRYRAMIRDCVRDGRMIGVCNTARQITPSKPATTLEQSLSSNQASYEPVAVFSAGPCEVIETTEDGRLLVNVSLSRRVRYQNEIQSVPYRIAACTELIDDSDDLSESTVSEIDQLQDRIRGVIFSLLAKQDPEVALRIDSDEWRVMSAEQFSFRVFSFLRFDADLMQNVLESTSPLQRLRMIAAILADHLDP